MAKDRSDEELLEWAEFVASKFSGNHEGWFYNRNLGELKHIRYEGDYTGHNHWTKRLKRAAQSWSIRNFFKSQRRSRLFTAGASVGPVNQLRDYFIQGAAASVVNLRKEKNLPDGQINGNLTHWEEDGEYIGLFQPLVGMEVIKFLRAEPASPHAQAIMREIRAASKRIYAEGAS